MTDPYTPETLRALKQDGTGFAHVWISRVDIEAHSAAWEAQVSQEPMHAKPPSLKPRQTA